jgi:hypothetical protein
MRGIVIQNMMVCEIDDRCSENCEAHEDKYSTSPFWFRISFAYSWEGSNSQSLSISDFINYLKDCFYLHCKNAILSKSTANLRPMKANFACFCLQSIKILPYDQVDHFSFKCCQYDRHEPNLNRKWSSLSSLIRTFVQSRNPCPRRNIPWKNVVFFVCKERLNLFMTVEVRTWDSVKEIDFLKQTMHHEMNKTWI